MIYHFSPLTKLTVGSINLQPVTPFTTINPQLLLWTHQESHQQPLSYYKLPPQAEKRKKTTRVCSCHMSGTEDGQQEEVLEVNGGEERAEGC